MKKMLIHLHEVKNLIKESEMEGRINKEDPYYPAWQALCDLEEKIQDYSDGPADRILMSKQKFVDAVMATNFDGRVGSIKISEIRKQLGRAYEMGQLSGIGKERERTYNVAVIIKGGRFDEIWSDRPNITVHKIDVDKDSDDPVIYNPEEAEYASMFNASEIVLKLTEKHKY